MFFLSFLGSSVEKAVGQTGPASTSTVYRTSRTFVMSDSQESAIERDFWSVWEAAWPLFPSGLPTFDFQCLTGTAIRTTRAPLLHADFAGLLFPGLAALGVTAELLPL